MCHSCKKWKNSHRQDIKLHPVGKAFHFHQIGHPENRNFYSAQYYISRLGDTFQIFSLY
jgi:hypothetical protein